MTRGTSFHSAAAVCVSIGVVLAADTVAAQCTNDGSGTPGDGSLDAISKVVENRLTISDLFTLPCVGKGTLDYTKLFQHFKPEMPHVWELSPTREAKQISDALLIWKKLFPETIDATGTPS